MRLCASVRRMEPQDTARVLDFLEVAFRDLGESAVGLEFHRPSVESMLRQSFMRGLVAFRSCELVGVAVLAIMPSPMDARVRIATELVWHAHPRLPEPRRFKIMVDLLRAMWGVAVEEGVQSLRVNPLPEARSKGLHRLLHQLGYVATHTCLGRTIHGS